MYGSRLWGVDSYGRLIGQYRHIWRPGENVATCNVLQAAIHMDVSGVDGYSLKQYLNAKSHVGCKGVEPKCTCGFYAYYDQTKVPTEGAVGVIEGYGLITEGPLGFRSMRAKIKAVVLGRHLVADLPLSGTNFMHDPKTNPSNPAQVEHNYPDVKFFDKVEDMYSEFPPNKPPLYDPDEAGFWNKPIG